jgi:hypothetical protein
LPETPATATISPARSCSETSSSRSRTPAGVLTFSIAQTTSPAFAVGRRTGAATAWPTIHWASCASVVPATGAWATSLPLRSTATRFETRSTSPSLWLMKTIESPCPDHLSERIEQGLAFLRREHGGGLVEDQDAGAAVERLQDLDPLPLAHGKTSHPCLRIDRQAEPIGHLGEPGTRLAPARERLPERLGAEHHVIEHAQVVGEREVLVHHADSRCQRSLRLARRQRLAEDLDRAGIGDVVAEQDRDQGRLAGAVLAEQRQHLAGAELERDRVVGQQRAEALGDAREAQDRSRAGHVGTPRGAYLAVDFGWSSSTLTVNLPAWMSASLALTLATTSAGTFLSNVPSGASSEPLCFIIE